MRRFIVAVCGTLALGALSVVPMTGATIRGTASFMDPAYGARYLALPGGPGLVVRICAGARCVVRRSNDTGPNRQMQRQGRVADLSFVDFRTLCACDPWAVGLIRVTVTPARIPAPPETSTAP